MTVHSIYSTPEMLAWSQGLDYPLYCLLHDTLAQKSHIGKRVSELTYNLLVRAFEEQALYDYLQEKLH